MFKSEYLFCCGKNGEINCERRDINLQLINIFDLILSENIKNLTIENHNNTFIELLYYEEKSESKNIYEYLFILLNVTILIKYQILIINIKLI